MSRMAVVSISIDGVLVVPLWQFSDERGSVRHMLKSTDAHFAGFGEIYFSTVHPGVVKGWKRHREMTVNYACIHGRVRLVLYDDRDGSRTHGQLMELALSPDDYALAVIPPGIWHGFQGAGPATAIIANCATQPSDPSELDRLDPGAPEIPYTWEAGPS